MTSTTDKSLTPVDAGLHGLPSESSRTMKRGLGVGGIVFMVVSGAAPMTTAAVSVPGTIAVTQNIGMPLFYLIAGAVLLLFTVGFTTMSRYVKNAGAFFAYIQAGLGRVFGLGAATLAIVSYYLLQASLVIFLGVGTANIIATYSGVEVPWLPLSALYVALVAYLGYRDIDLSAKVLGVLLVIETLAVIILDVAIAVKGGADGITVAPFEPAVFQQGAPAVALMFAFLGFVGFEVTAVFRNEARDPDKTVPRATYISVIVIGLFYALSSWMVVVGAGADSVIADAAADPSTLVVTLAGEYVSPMMVHVLQVLLVTSILAAVLSFHNVISRYQHALAVTHVLPKALAVIHPRHGVPARSSLVVTVITFIVVVAFGLSGLDPLLQANAWLSGAATLGILVLLALTGLAVIFFFRRTNHEKNLWRTVIAPALATIALSTVVVLVVSNFVLFVGDPVVATVIECVVVAAFLFGAIVALVLRSRRPDVYADLDTTTR